MSSLRETSTDDSGSPLDAVVRGLDPDQREAVTAPAGLIVVRAGAGSGKTTVLTRRIAWRVLADEADPVRMLAITFTRQAATEMRTRLHRFDLGGSPVVGTFHAVGRRILHERCEDQGRRPPLIATNRSSIMSAALGDDARRGGLVPDLLSLHDWGSSMFLDARATAAAARDAGRSVTLPEKRLTEVLDAYTTLKRRRGVVDLNDYLSLVVDEARRDPRFVESVRFRFRHLSVDEAQDMNPLQWEFLRTLAGDDPDLFLVGDPNQAIYGFNGSDSGLLADLPGLDGGARIIALPSNYRCTPEIVGFAVGALSRDGQTAEAASRRAPGDPVRLERCADGAAEAARIVAAVNEAVAEGRRWEEIAVLVRVNAFADVVRSVLERAGIPVRTRIGGADWSRAVSVAVALTGRDELTTWSCDILDSGEYDPREMDHVVASQVRAYLDAHRSGSVDGRGFSTWLATSGDVREAEGVDVLTFHAAKGREWPVVVVVGAEKGMLPHRSARGPVARAEEARLAYVAFTRAADRLVVCWTDSRDGRRTGPSPLLPALSTADPVRDAPGEDFRRLVPRTAPVDPVAGALNEWRENRARSSRTLPDAVLTDRQMASLLAAHPLDADVLERILGPVFARRFGGELLPILARPASR